MTYLLRISQKLLFICNLCWVASVVFRVIPLDHWPDVVVKSVLVLGWLAALPFGLVWYGTAVFFFCSGRLLLRDTSRWLTLLNLLFIPAVIIGYFIIR